MIGGLPHETSLALGRDIALALWTWLGCVLFCAVVAAIFAAMAWRSTGRRRTVFGLCATIGALLSVALLVSLLATVGP